MTISISEWIETPPTPERLKEVDTDDLWSVLCILRVQKECYPAHDLVRGEILRRARLGAAVEAMPKTITLSNRGTGGHLLGDAWDVDGMNDDEDVTALTPLEALQEAAKTEWWQKALRAYGT